MAAVTIDTKRIVEILEESGVSKKQAKGISRAFEELEKHNLATKADVADTKSAITDLKAEMYKLALIQAFAQVTLIVTLIKLL